MAGEGGAGSAPGRAWSTRDVRLRTQRREQPVDAVRGTGRLETRGGDGAAHEGRLGAADPIAGGPQDYPDQRIVLVMNHLNMHAPASLYEAFELAEARRIRPVPEPSPARPRSPMSRSGCLAGAKKSRSRCEWTGDSRPPTHGPN